MNRDEQRIAIAKACGWTCIGQVPGLNPHGLPPWRSIDEFTTQQVLNHEVPLDTLPDYLGNLNAMHEAEKTLPEGLVYKYSIQLMLASSNPSPNDMWRHQYSFMSTAVQRAESFLRTLNLWEDES